MPASDPVASVTSDERLSIEENGREASHIALRLDRPAGHTDDLCVVYMHGFGSSQSGEKASFARERVASFGLPFCSFDFQGHGASGGSMFDLSLSRNLEDLGRVHGFLRARGLRRLVLMGSSMGGNVGLWYAAHHPDDIVAAMHVAPALELETGLMRLVGPEAASRWQRDGYVRLAHDLVTTELSWDLIEDLRGFDLERLQSRYRTPTLIFQGKHDTSVDPRAVIDFVTGCAFEGIELHLFADGDHRLLPKLDHLWRTTHSFLTANDALSPSSP